MDRGAWRATVHGVAKSFSTHVWMSESRKNDLFSQGSQNPGNKQSDNAKVTGSTGFIAQPKLWEVKEGFLEEVTLGLRYEAWGEVGPAKAAGRAGKTWCSSWRWAEAASVLAVQCPLFQGSGRQNGTIVGCPVTQQRSPQARGLRSPAQDRESGSGEIAVFLGGNIVLLC